VALITIFDFLPKDKTEVAIMARNTLMAEACKARVVNEMETPGDKAYYWTA